MFPDDVDGHCAQQYAAGGGAGALFPLRFDYRGAEKFIAIQIIRELEPGRVGALYGASAGSGAGGDFSLSVAIRRCRSTATDGYATAWAVASSGIRRRLEYQECLLKAAFPDTGRSGIPPDRNPAPGWLFPFARGHLIASLRRRMLRVRLRACGCRAADACLQRIRQGFSACD